jgi:hypothetical protein
LLPFATGSGVGSSLDEIDSQAAAMLGFLENQVMPELARLDEAIKKRDNWAMLVAQNEVHEQRVLEESSIM